MTRARVDCPLYRFWQPTAVPPEEVPIKSNAKAVFVFHASLSVYTVQSDLGKFTSVIIMYILVSLTGMFMYI